MPSFLHADYTIFLPSLLMPTLHALRSTVTPPPPLNSCRFGVAEGDLPSFLNIWKAWLAHVRDKRWSYKNYVSHRSMLRAGRWQGLLSGTAVSRCVIPIPDLPPGNPSKHGCHACTPSASAPLTQAFMVPRHSILAAADIRFQLESHLKRAGLDWRSTALGPGAQGDAASGLLTVRKACAAGLFMQAARLTEELVVDKAGGIRALLCVVLCLLWGKGVCIHVSGREESGSDDVPPVPIRPNCDKRAQCQVSALSPRPDARDAGASVYRLVRSGGGEAAAAKLRIHHSSVLFRCRPSWVCFYGAEQNDTGWCAEGERVVVVRGGAHCSVLRPLLMALRRLTGVYYIPTFSHLIVHSH